MLTTITIRRTAAVGAAVSGLLHLLMIGHGSHLAGVLLMSALAIVCLPCAGHLWRAASRRSWTIIAMMNTAMLALHLWMSGPDTAAPSAAAETVVVQGHVHGAAGIADAGAADTGSLVDGLHELLLPLASAVALAEILLAAAGLVMLRRDAARARR